MSDIQSATQVKSGSKKTVSIIIGVLGLVLAIAGASYFFLLRNNPKLVLYRALQSSIQLLDKQMIELAESIGFKKDVREALEDGAFSIETTLDSNNSNSWQDYSIMLSYNYDRKNKKLYAELFPDRTNKTEKFVLEADKDNLYLAMPQLPGIVFSAKTKHMEKQWNDSFFGTFYQLPSMEISLDFFSNKYKNAIGLLPWLLPGLDKKLQNHLKEVLIVKDKEESTKAFGTTTASVYAITIYRDSIIAGIDNFVESLVDSPLFAEMASAYGLSKGYGFSGTYMERSEEKFEYDLERAAEYVKKMITNDVVLYLKVAKNTLTGISADISIDDNKGRLYILLEGETNPWQTVTLGIIPEDEDYIPIKMTIENIIKDESVNSSLAISGGHHRAYKNSEYKEKISFVYKRNNGNFILSSSGNKLFEGNMKYDQGFVFKTKKIPSSAAPLMQFRIAPLTEAVSSLPKQKILAIFELTESELMELSSSF